MKRCLYCYRELDNGEMDFHPGCARKLFCGADIRRLPYRRSDISDLAREVVRSSTTVTGVQAKLSLGLTGKGRGTPQRFTIGLWGSYILKPQTEEFANLPEIEDLTMHLAEIAKMQVVPHSLIRFADGELCYITRRIDRTGSGEKVPMEDMCQLTDRLTEHKYRGSYEQIARAVRRFSCVPQLDAVAFWEQVVFSWLTGNSDMHLKNFSLYNPGGGYRLTPAYDLLSTVLVMPQDTEELALTLNAKKRRIRREDFIAAMRLSGLDDKVSGNVFRKFIRCESSWADFIDISFLPAPVKAEYIRLISSRLAMLR